jgi:toxoflavin biosynthesis protein ToxD
VSDRVSVFLVSADADHAVCDSLKRELLAAGANADIEVDAWGGDHLLWGSEWAILVLTPQTLTSHWAFLAMKLALQRQERWLLRGVLVLLAEPVEPSAMPAEWARLPQFDLPRDPVGEMLRLLGLLGLDSNAPRRPAPSPRWVPAERALSSAPMQRLPPRLLSLGFTRHSTEVDYLLPPLCPVPAGPFLMGTDPRQESKRDLKQLKRVFSWSQPQHWVMLPTFHIACYPVTVAEFACFVVGHQLAKNDDGYDLEQQWLDWDTQLAWELELSWRDQLATPDHPVDNVNWHDAMGYAAWLARLTGQPWRLATEAEWEKAARWDPHEGASHRYPWGDAFDPTKANTMEGGVGTTTPVGSYPTGASPYGAQDMAGNAQEWTRSLWRAYPYRAEDGREDVAQREKPRVIRGGSWSNWATRARADRRAIGAPEERYGGLGFRLVCGDPAEEDMQAEQESRNAVIWNPVIPPPWWREKH